MPQLSPLTSHFSPRPAALRYNSALSLWLSVDPLSDKYPSTSPYVYCADNPVRLKDPDGRDIWEINEYGYSRCVEKSNTEHKIFFTKGKSENSFGKRVTTGLGENKQEVCISNENVDEFMNSFHPAGNGGHLYSFIKDENKEDFAKQFMKTVSKYTAVEWGYTGTIDNLRHISTSHTEGMDALSADIVLKANKDQNLLFACHTQPNSYFASNEDWRTINILGNHNATFGIIHDRRLFDFNGFSMDWSQLTSKIAK